MKHSRYSGIGVLGGEEREGDRVVPQWKDIVSSCALTILKVLTEVQP